MGTAAFAYCLPATRRFLAGVSAESASGRKFTELMADHFFGDIHRHVFTAVVYSAIFVGYGVMRVRRARLDAARAMDGSHVEKVSCPAAGSVAA